MSDHQRSSKVQMPDLPRDLPMPRYKYQQEEKQSERFGQGGTTPHDAAALLRGYDFMGCAASKPIRP